MFYIQTKIHLCYLKTLVSELKIEKEANYFATHLTIDPTLDGFDHMTKYEKLVCFGLPDEFDRYL